MDIKYAFLDRELGTPETRFFILKLCDCFNKGETICWQIKVLCKQWGLTNQAVIDSLSFLHHMGYLEKLKVVEGKRGRPQGRYAFTNKLNGLANEIKNIDLSVSIKNVIGTLLIVGKEEDKLKVSNRLLLCVLIANSRGYGVVNNLSAKDISKLTGMTKDAIRSQTKKLIGLGYINKYVAGIGRSNIIGESASIYFLALREKFALYIGKQTKMYSLEYFLCVQIEIIKNNMMRLSFDSDFQLFKNESSFKNLYFEHHKAFGRYDHVLLEQLKHIFKKDGFTYLTVYHFQLRMEGVLCDYLASEQNDTQRFMMLNKENINKKLFNTINANSVFTLNDRKCLLEFVCQFIDSFNQIVKFKCRKELEDHDKFNYQIIYADIGKILVRYVD